MADIQTMVARESATLSALEDLNERIRMSGVRIRPLSVRVVESVATLTEPMAWQGVGDESVMQSMFSDVGMTHGLGGDWLSAERSFDMEDVEWATGKLVWKTRLNMSHMVVECLDRTGLLQLRLVTMDTNVKEHVEIYEKALQDAVTLCDYLGTDLKALKGSMSDVIIHNEVWTDLEAMVR